MRRVGVLGSMVWDRIYARDQRSEPVEEWGGISYALAGAVAAATPEWQIVPIVKIGADLAEPALFFLQSMRAFDLDTGVRIVDAPNNRVELRYRDKARRFERLSGGVPAWSWDELAPIIDTLDALYINLISGFELELATAQQLRRAFHGPIYTDLHSIFLGVGPDGTRVPRPLEHWPEWLRCFDIVQMNEDELGMLAGVWQSGDPWRIAADVVGDDTRLLLITLGERGAAYIASPACEGDPLDWHRRGIVRPALARSGGAARSARIAVSAGPREGDPTGCGDVWGATCALHLFRGAPLESAVRAANHAAARNVEHRGASGLHHHLSGRLGT
jgi:sugar/nucleoside kinase (ribokinase family)